MIEIIIALIVGSIWGYILYKAMVCDHGCIIGGLSLKNLTMLLVIMTSVVTTALIIYPLSAVGIVKLIPKPTYVLGNVLGGAILGIGMALAGYCPGTAIASLGSGKIDALVTIMGGLAGAVLYAVMFPVLKPYLVDPLSYGKITLPDLLAVKMGIPTLLSAFILIGLFIVAIVYMAKLQGKLIHAPLDKVSKKGETLSKRLVGTNQ
ncbi:MAG: DUF6691 family protein [Bacillota bacterium]|uniref:YeeE/YedE family protein n=1 Tax=Thermanaerosceptrum fracticalcis TaxID=1712410 RepID=A0A7G6E5F7_THEFR|nr:DUF6691 family protein [Thermanaerosceptrum fracticalcis]QNB47311.1 YeeE/YedE family protein [Thermanaerosceptrum fracticalcis]